MYGNFFGQLADYCRMGRDQDGHPTGEAGPGAGYFVSMRAPGSWPTRAAGGLLCGAACLILGAVSHAAVGGRLPGAGVLGLLFAALAVQGRCSSAGDGGVSRS